VGFERSENVAAIGEVRLVSGRAERRGRRICDRFEVGAKIRIVCVSWIGTRSLKRWRRALMRMTILVQRMSESGLSFLQTLQSGAAMPNDFILR